MGGLKVAVGFAFTGAVVGEFVASTPGLGCLLQFAQSTYNPSLTPSIVLPIVGFVPVLFSWAERLERHLPRWHPTYRGGTTERGPRCPRAASRRLRAAPETPPGVRSRVSDAASRWGSGQVLDVMSGRSQCPATCSTSQEGEDSIFPLNAPFQWRLSSGTTERDKVPSL